MHLAITGPTPAATDRFAIRNVLTSFLQHFLGLRPLAASGMPVPLLESRVDIDLAWGSLAGFRPDMERKIPMALAVAALLATCLPADAARGEVSQFCSSRHRLHKGGLKSRRMGPIS